MTPRFAQITIAAFALSAGACDVGKPLTLRSVAVEPMAIDAGPITPNVGCDLSVGNFDCPDGTGCVDYQVQAGRGECEPNAHGLETLFVFCDDADDCYGGLCFDGVCTHPCAYDPCPDAYYCDTASDVTSGVCRPTRCETDPEMCGAGFVCAESPAGIEVCAAASEGGCAATQVPRSPTAFGVVGLAVLVGLMRRRHERAGPNA